MKTRYIWIMAMAVFALTGCQKERVNGNLELIAEGMNGNTKLAINGLQSYWVNGESVNINGTEYNITVNASENGKAYVNSGNEVESSCYGVYPASIIGNSNINGQNYTLTLPASYIYATTTFDGNTVQNLASPMVAYATSGATRLYFKHVTAAVGVQVVNYYGFTIQVDSIVVSSDNYKLNGSVTVDMSTINNEDFSVAAQSGSTNAEKRVKMVFGDSDKLQIFAGDSAVVQVPVLPVGTGNHFTVKICVHKVDQPAVAKTMEKTQNNGGTLVRAKIGYARFTTPGLFSVSDSKKVVISQGNLMYNMENGEWSFMTTQYGTVETESQDVGKDYASQNIVSLFGWGTSGWNNGNYLYQPNKTGDGYSSSKGYGFGPTDGSSYLFGLTGDYSNSDWGVYNAISNGGGSNGRWRTLTSNSDGEVYYMLYTRSTTTSGLPSGTNSTNAKYIKGTIGGINGLFLFPDNYSHSADIAITSSSPSYNQTAGTYNYDRFGVSLENWYKMEAEGVVFLPAAGYRNGKEVMKYGEYGVYWSASTVASGTAYSLYIINDGYSYLFSGKNRNWGCSVRLVRDVR